MDFTTSFDGSSDKSQQKPAHHQKSGLIYTGSYSYKAKTETVNVVPQAIPTAFAAGPDQGMNQQHFSGYQATPPVPAPKPTNQMQVASVQSNAQRPVSADNAEQKYQSGGYSSAASEPRVFFDMDTKKYVQESDADAARIGAANNTGLSGSKTAFDSIKSNYQQNYQPMQPAKPQVNVDVSSMTKNSAMATAPNVYGNQPNYHQVQPAKQQQMQGYNHQQNGSQGVAPGDPTVQHVAAHNRGQYQYDNQNIPPHSAISSGNRPLPDYQNGMKPTLPYPSLPGQFGQGNNLMQPNLPLPGYNRGGQTQMPPQHGHANTGGRYGGHYGSQQPNNYHHYHRNQQNAQQQQAGHGLGGNQQMQTGYQQNQYGRDPASSFRFASNYAREAYAQEQRHREEAAQERRRAAAANRAAQRERDAEKEQASPNKKRKQRITLTDQQRNFLESFYNQCKYPLSDQTESLSYNTGLTFKELKTWFKNRRSKDRREGRLIRR